MAQVHAERVAGAGLARRGTGMGRVHGRHSGAPVVQNAMTLQVMVKAKTLQTTASAAMEACYL
jgi:hypothetical protein